MRRERIRKTWGKNEQNVVFLIGNACPWPEKLLEHKNFCNHPNMSTSQLQGWRNEIMDYRIGQKNITMKISKEKRDVKILDVVDSPIYLNKKLQHGFKFVIENFPMARYIAKVSDDSYVRPKKLLQWMRNEERKNFTLIAKEYKDENGVVDNPSLDFVMTRPLARYIGNSNRDNSPVTSRDDIFLNYWVSSLEKNKNVELHIPVLPHYLITNSCLNPRTVMVMKQTRESLEKCYSGDTLVETQLNMDFNFQ